MGVAKWILTGLGWVTLGPLGGLTGYFVGRWLENLVSTKQRLGDGSDYYMGQDGVPHSNHHGPYRNTGTQNDIDIALLVLIAAVMKADDEVKRAELDYVKQFLLKNYGEDKGKDLLAMLRDLVKPETYIDLDGVCIQIKQNTDYTTRYHMVDFLFGLAVSDNSYTQTENTVMRTIAHRLGINSGDYTSIYARHVLSRFGGSRQSNYSYSGGYQDRSQSRSSSTNIQHEDPYKILGIDKSATDEEVKKAYRRMAMKYHPDRVDQMGEEVKRNAAEQFRRINEAYEQIKTSRGMK